MSTAKLKRIAKPSNTQVENLKKKAKALQRKVDKLWNDANCQLVHSQFAFLHEEVVKALKEKLTLVDSDGCTETINGKKEYIHWSVYEAGEHFLLFIKADDCQHSYLCDMSSIRFVDENIAELVKYLTLCSAASRMCEDFCFTEKQIKDLAAEINTRSLQQAS